MHIRTRKHTNNNLKHAHILLNEKQSPVTFSISSYSFDAQANLSNLHLKPVKNKTIVNIILNKYIHVHIHEKGIRTTKLMFFWGRRHFEPASVDSLFLHSTCWPRLKSAQSHCTQHLAQTEIGTVSLYTGLGPNWNRRSLTVHRHLAQTETGTVSLFTGVGPNGDRHSLTATLHARLQKNVSIQYWANLALTQHLNLNISPPPPHTNTHAMQRSWRSWHSHRMIVAITNMMNRSCSDLGSDKK